MLTVVVVPGCMNAKPEWDFMSCSMAFWLPFPDFSAPIAGELDPDRSLRQADALRSLPGRATKERREQPSSPGHRDLWSTPRGPGEPPPGVTIPAASQACV